MIRLWIDCEWNDYRGDLISMALVSEDYEPFYQELVCSAPSQWITGNVIPHLGKETAGPVAWDVFQTNLAKYLDIFDGEHLTIIADWPEDIEHFCRALIVGPGRSLAYQHITFECLMGSFKDCTSKVPHHALFDAMANRDHQVKEEQR